MPGERRTGRALGPVRAGHARTAEADCAPWPARAGVSKVTFARC